MGPESRKFHDFVLEPDGNLKPSEHMVEYQKELARSLPERQKPVILDKETLAPDADNSVENNQKSA